MMPGNGANGNEIPVNKPTQQPEVDSTLVDPAAAVNAAAYASTVPQVNVLANAGMNEPPIAGPNGMIHVGQVCEGVIY